MWKLISGILLILMGIAAGIYLGFYVMLVKSIIDLVYIARDFSHGADIPLLRTVFDIIKIPLAGTVGWLAAILFFIPGFVRIFK